MIQEKTMVGFFDILGYDKLVQKMITEADFIAYCADSIYNISVNLPDFFKKGIEKSETIAAADHAYLKEILHTIKTRYIFDNFILSLPLSQIPQRSEKFDQKVLDDSLREYFEEISYPMMSP